MSEKLEAMEDTVYDLMPATDVDACRALAKRICIAVLREHVQPMLAEAFAEGSSDARPEAAAEAYADRIIKATTKENGR